MDEEAIEHAYDLFVKDGYKKDISTFVKLMDTNAEAKSHAYLLFRKDGYKKSMSAFDQLMGVKKKEPTGFGGIVRGDISGLSTEKDAIDTSLDGVGGKAPKEKKKDKYISVPRAGLVLDTREEETDLYDQQKTAIGQRIDKKHKDITFDNLYNEGLAVFENDGLKKRDFEQFKQKKFRELVERDLQPEYFINKKIDSIAKEAPYINRDAAFNRIFQNRIEEGVQLLPDARSKELFKLNIEVHNLKETLKETPSDSAQDQLIDAMERRSRLMADRTTTRGLSKGVLFQDSYEAFFDEERNIIDNDFKAAGETKETFLAGMSNRMRQIEKIKDRGDLIKIWNDSYEKYKAVKDKTEAFGSEMNFGGLPYPKIFNRLIGQVPIMELGKFLDGEDGEFDKYERRKQTLEYLNTQVAEAKKDFMSVNHVLLTNVDPGSIRRKAFDLTFEGLRGSFKEDAYSRAQTPERYAGVINQYGGRVTNKQALAAKVSILDQSLRGVGATLPIMAEIAMTMAVTQGIGSAPAVARLGKVIKGFSRAKFGKFGEASYNVMSRAASSGLAFELAPSDETTFAMGVGEGLSENMIRLLSKKLGAFKKPFSRFAARVIGGTGTEGVAEYAGELLNELSENGFDVDAAVEEVVGATADERIRKAATTFLLTSMLSTSGATIRAMFDKVYADVESVEDGTPGKEELKDALDDFKQGNKKAFEKSEGDDGSKDIEDVVVDDKETVDQDATTPISDAPKREFPKDDGEGFIDPVYMDDVVDEETETEDVLQGQTETTEQEPRVAVDEEVGAPKREATDSKKPKPKQQQAEYRTNDFQYNISKGDDGLVFKTAVGKPIEVSANTKRKYEQEYLTSQNWNVGERAVEAGADVSDGDINERIADESKNAVEVAQTLQYERDNKPEPDRIVDEVIGRQISTESFKEHSDANNITGGLAKAWLRKGGEKLDMVAMEIEKTIYGDYNANSPRITEEDIVNIILDHPNNFAKKRTEIEEALEIKFRELTGVTATKKNVDAVLSTDLETAQTEAAPQETVNVDTEDVVDPDEVPFQFERASTPVFISSAKEGIGKVTQKAATPEQWVKMVADKGGKGTSQELEWMGLEDYLNEWKKENKAKSVPKEVVEQYIADNQIEIVEVTKNEPNEGDIEALLGDEVGEGMTREEAIEYLKNDEGGIKYSKYTLEGGENYREVLLTLPEKEAQHKYVVFEKQKIGSTRVWGYKNESTGQEMMGDFTDRYQLDRFVRYKNNELKYNYKSSHWDEANVLAHLRLNERTLPNGERVLFIEEIQSDWAQEGKKKGFLKSDGKDLIVFREKMKKKYGNSWYNDRTDLEIAKDNRLVNEVMGISNMPYKKTDQWVSMAMRRAMQMAAEGGFERIAWVTGEQSADRYDLSKQISLASAIKNDGGTYNLVLEDKRGDELREYRASGKTMTPSEMESTIGKDLAAKLIEGADRNQGKEWKKGQSVNPEFFTLTGVDLKVGGEGMKTFYNSILPKVAEKEAKRFDKQARVAVVEFKETGKQLSIPITDKMKAVFEKGVPFFQDQQLFRPITRIERRAIVRQLKKALPTKVSDDWNKARKVLKELGHNVDALFGNEVMAFTPATKKLFEQAKKMDAQGKTPAETREATGWFIGLDGNWKFTIDDSNAEILQSEQRIAKLAKGKTVATAKAYPLKGILKHPELEQYFPDLVDKIKVKFYESQDKNQGGDTENHSDGTYTIRINKDFREANNWKQLPLTLSHEIQHVIQGLERSVKGNRVADLGGTREEDLYKLLKRGKLNIYREGSDKEIKYSHLTDTKLRLWARKLYESHSEEIGARAAANGNDLRGEIPQLNTPFYWVESVDRNNKVILKNVRDVQYIRNRANEPLGFVDPRNGNIYLHPNKINANTPIHEFGHLYVKGIKQKNKTLYDKGITLVKGTEYHERVKNHPGYQNLSEKQQLEEALVTAIGDQGEAFIHDQKKRSAFRAFLERLKKWILRYVFRAHKKPFKDRKSLEDLDLNAFLNGSLRDLFDGQNLGLAFAQDGTVMFQREDAPNNEEPSLKKTNGYLKGQLNRLRVSTDSQTAIRKEVVDYVNNVMLQENLSDFSRSDLRTLLAAVQKAKTVKTLAKAIASVNEKVADMQARRDFAKIAKLLKRKFTTVQSGRRKANLTDPETAQTFKGIKSLLKEMRNRQLGKETKQEKDQEAALFLDELREQLELHDNGDKVLDDMTLSAIKMAIRVGTAMTSSDVYQRKEQAEKMLEDLTDLYDFGRDNQKAFEEAKRERMDAIRDKANDEVDPSGEGTILTTSELENRKKEFFTRMLERGLYVGFNKWTADLESVFRVMSKKGSERVFGGFFFDEVSSQLRSAETMVKFNLRQHNKEIEQNKKEIYGKGINADARLNEVYTFKVARKEGEGEIPLTVAELVYLHMNYKNKALHGRFESNGFTKAFMSDVDKVLTKQDREYSEYLFDVYDRMWTRVNKVYERMYNHPLGKPAFYAGKLFSDVKDVEDLEVLANASINRTPAGGSSKERVANNRPLVAVSSDYALRRYLLEMEHYIGHAELYQKISAFKDNKGFRALVMKNNPNVGDILLKKFDKYIDEIVLRNKRTSTSKIIDALYSNFVRSTLAVKPKIAITQTLSFINGLEFLPDNMGYALYGLSPERFIQDTKHLFRTDEYLKNRLGSEELLNALANMNTTNVNYLGAGSTKADANIKRAVKEYQSFLNALMLNVKVGDFIGVMGSVPVYTAYKKMYLDQKKSPKEAERLAKIKFRLAVDRAQQTQSSYGKSFFQTDPFARMFVMYSSAPLQFYRHVQSSGIELIRKLKKQESKGKTRTHLWRMFNYGMLQPYLYAYVNQLAYGTVRDMFDDDEENNTEFNKSLVSAIAVGTLSSAPITGDAILFLFDKLVLKKAHTFGTFVDAALLREVLKLEKHIDWALEGKTEETRKKHFIQALHIAIGFSGLPADTVMHYREVIDTYVASIGTKDEWDEYEMMEKFGLWSGWNKKYVVDQRKLQRELDAYYKKQKRRK